MMKQKQKRGLAVHAVDYRPESGGYPGRYSRGRRGLIRRDSLTHRVIYAWFNMRKSTRQLVTQKPSETRLLLILLFSDLLFFLSWTMKAVIVPHETGASLISAEVGGLFLVSIFGRTAAMYVFAMFLGAVSRILGGRGTWRNTRIAVFWGAFVTAPFGVVAAIFSVAFTNLAVYFPIFSAPWIAQPPYYIGMLPFVWYISVGVAKVHGFRSVSPVFMAMSLLALVGLLGGMYFHAVGMI